MARAMQAVSGHPSWSAPSSDPAFATCGRCHAASHDEDQATLRRASRRRGRTGPGVAPAEVHDVLQTGGQPLPAEVQRRAKSHFGHDFSRVRVHSDARAARSAQAVDARAYTVGHHVVFDRGEYSPATRSGNTLLMHELAHVVQQRGRPIPSVLRIGAASDAKEAEADRMATSASASASASASEPATVRRAAHEEALTEPDVEPESDLDVDEALKNGTIAGPEDIPASEFSLAELGLVDEETEGEEELAAEEATVQRQPKKKAPEPKPKEKGKGKGKTAQAAKKSKGKVVRIDVDLTSQKMTWEWTDGSKDSSTISSGRGKRGVTEPCPDGTTTAENCTPVGTFHPRTFHGANYKNKDGDAMSHFIRFDGKAGDRGIGIHDAQPVTGSPASHGCVRAPAKVAKTLHDNATKDTVIVVTGAIPKPKAKAKPKPKAAPKKK